MLFFVSFILGFYFLQNFSLVSFAKYRHFFNYWFWFYFYFFRNLCIYLSRFISKQELFRVQSRVESHFREISRHHDHGLLAHYLIEFFHFPCVGLIDYQSPAMSSSSGDIFYEKIHSMKCPNHYLFHVVTWRILSEILPQQISSHLIAAFNKLCLIHDPASPQNLKQVSLHLLSEYVLRY